KLSATRRRPAGTGRTRSGRLAGPAPDGQATRRVPSAGPTGGDRPWEARSKSYSSWLKYPVLPSPADIRTLAAQYLASRNEQSATYMTKRYFWVAGCARRDLR